MAACRSAREEWTREHVLLQSAATQTNLGNALSTLGERESGSTRLEEAVAACRAALASFIAAGANHYINVCRNNRDRARTALAKTKNWS